MHLQPLTQRPGLRQVPACLREIPRQTGCRPGDTKQRVRKRARRCRAQTSDFERQRRLQQAASEYAEGVERGISEDDIVAMQLGAPDVSGLTQRQQAYVDKITLKLSQQAAEAKRQKDQNNVRFGQGKRAYSTGQYAASEILFQEALEKEGKMSALGGEIQMWLALAYQANGKEQQCIEVYKSIEKNHPMPKVRRQAADLRYIMEAPKLVIGPDERVTIPILQDQSRYTKSRGSRTRNAPRPPPISSNQKLPKSLEEQVWENYKPPIPDMMKNRYFLVASGVIATGVAWYSAVLNRAMHAR